MRVKDKDCIAPDCTRKAKILSEGRPVCNMHWQRWYTKGTFEGREPSPHSSECVCEECGKDFVKPYRMSDKRKRKGQYCSAVCLERRRDNKRNTVLETRFWSKVRVAGPDECWEWQAQLSKAGYGCFNYKRGKTPLAHRISFMLKNGYLPDPEVLVCHSCDNPKCVNPRHLWLGDNRANHEDCVAKGRHSPLPVSRGSAVNTAKLTEDQAREVLNSPLSNKQLAQKFGVTGTAIRLIRIGKNWSHLQEAS